MQYIRYRIFFDKVPNGTAFLKRLSDRLTRKKRYPCIVSAVQNVHFFASVYPSLEAGV